MDTLEEKYLKVLKTNLGRCDQAYRELWQRRMELVETIKSLYSSWVPAKVYSFFSTIKAWAKNGFKKSKYLEVRWDICKKCPNLKDESLCTLCGCYMKRKVDLEGAKCPISKW